MFIVMLLPISDLHTYMLVYFLLMFVYREYFVLSIVVGLIFIFHDLLMLLCIVSGSLCFNLDQLFCLHDFSFNICYVLFIPLFLVHAQIFLFRGLQCIITSSIFCRYILAMSFYFMCVSSSIHLHRFPLSLVCICIYMLFVFHCVFI